MKETRLGITKNLLVAILFLSGILVEDGLYLIILGCVLYLEENQWIRTKVKQALNIFIVFAGIDIAIMVIRQISTLFNNAIVIHDKVIFFLELVKNVILITCAITTLTGKNFAVKESKASIIQEKHENTNRQIEVKKEESYKKVCKKCGKPLPEDAGFCVYCGAKQ